VGEVPGVREDDETARLPLRVVWRP